MAEGPRLELGWGLNPGTLAVCCITIDATLPVKWRKAEESNPEGLLDPAVFKTVELANVLAFLKLVFHDGIEPPTRRSSGDRSTS